MENVVFANGFEVHIKGLKIKPYPFLSNLKHWLKINLTVIFSFCNLIMKVSLRLSSPILPHMGLKIVSLVLKLLNKMAKLNTR